ncbi:M50 family metallopeptidase [Chondromyces apiculatus]|uniref:Membrane-associated zinc metalloprotease n=1 Tax=Chondromyces apiculatus DSM 436 TaxID=1192034 RepID=A0A017TCL3_9BACT|nr:M50 family metallopeptidase [Chondromyces apiculatus]EYF06647.1 Membrane-associated zinc metalloprotease [Chondromyces apiculatus DSM 436]
MAAWYIVLGFVGLALLMVVHEAGHFFAARAYGMRVLKFSIGVGPTFFKIIPEDGFFWFTTAAGKVRLRLWRHSPERHGPTVFQFAMIPLLAYVQIDGMNPLEEVDPNDKGSYANASLLGRIVAIFAGPAANYLFASVLFFASLMIGGKPVIVDGKVVRSNDVDIVADSPAAAAQLRDGDRIVEVAGVPVKDFDKMAEIISKNPDKPLVLGIEREGSRLDVTVTPRNDNGKGKIGVSARFLKEPVQAKEAAVLAITMPPTVVKNFIVGLGQWITGKVQGELGGPKRVIEETANAAKRGLSEYLEFLGALSAYLGAFNLLPFPALDGGRLMFLLYEATTRRRPNATLEMGIHFAGFVVLVLLVSYVTIFNDLGVGTK